MTCSSNPKHLKPSFTTLNQCKRETFGTYQDCNVNIFMEPVSGSERQEAQMLMVNKDRDLKAICGRLNVDMGIGKRYKAERNKCINASVYGKALQTCCDRRKLS